MASFICAGITSRCGLEKPGLTEQNKLNCSGRIVASGIIADAFIFVTALVIGILGLLGFLQGMPPAAAYTLLGISGTIGLIWMGFIALSKGEAISASVRLLKMACCSNPAADQ